MLSISSMFMLTSEQWLHACGGDMDPYDQFPSFFQPSLADAPAYTPFYYTSSLKYYDDWYDYKDLHNLPDENLRGWQEYTKTQVPLPDLDSFIYTFPRPELAKLYSHIDNKVALAVNTEMKKNAFTQWFLKNKDLEALGYLMYAKQCEQYATTQDWESPKRDTARMNRLIKDGLQLHAAAKQAFFQWRYRYQVLRMALYSDQPRRTLSLYNTLIGDLTGSGYVYYRCLGLKAGAMFRLDQKTEAAYLYSIIFDHSDQQKRSAYISFDWCTTKDLSAVTKLCKNNHEKAVVYILDGLNDYSYGLPAMQKAYELDPKVKGMDVMMTREINKVEQRLLSGALDKERNLSAYWWYYNMEPQEKEADKYTRYLKNLQDFAVKLATDNKRGDAAFWWLSAAYSSFIKKDMVAAKGFLAKAEMGKQTSRERAMHDLIKVLITLRGNGNITAQTEADVLPIIKALEARMMKQDDEATKVYANLNGHILATAYLQNKDTVKALYALAKANYYSEGKYYGDESFMDLPGALLEESSVEKLQEIAAFYSKPSKTEFEQWLVKDVTYTPDLLASLEGTKYLRNHDFNRAVSTFKKVSPAVMNTIVLSNPFRVSYSDRQDLEEDDMKPFYTKLSFAKKMLELQQKIERQKQAQDMFDFATGLYSMTYYGNSSYAYTYYRSSVDDKAYYITTGKNAPKADAEKEFYGAFKAETYYLKAAAAFSGNKEMQAQSLFMAAKCWQKRCPPDFGKPDAKPKNYYQYGDYDYYLYSLTSPHFAKLVKEYADTKAFQEAYNTCSYLRNYAPAR